MTTPANTSDKRSILWEMLEKADAEAKRRIAAIEANMIWSKIDISENPSNFSEEIVEESEVDEDQSEDEYDTDEVLSSDNEEFDDDDDYQMMVSGDEESANEEESEDDRYNRQFLELNWYGDSDSE